MHDKSASGIHFETYTSNPLGTIIPTYVFCTLQTRHDSHSYGRERVNGKYLVAVQTADTILSFVSYVLFKN